MDSGDGTSSDSSASGSKPRPGGGVSEEEAEGVYYPPHFPQRGGGGGISGSDFSPHSDDSSEEEEEGSSDEVRGQSPAPPPISIRTYAPPTTLYQNDDSENDTGSGMDSGQTSRHGSVPYQPVPIRRRPVNYKQFYSGRASSEESGSEVEEGEGVGWGRRRGKGKVRMKHFLLTQSIPPSQGDSDESEFELSADGGEEEEDSFSEMGEESSEWEEPGRGQRKQQKGWLVSGSDSDYQPGGGGRVRGGRKGRKRQPKKNHWRE